MRRFQKFLFLFFLFSLTFETGRAGGLPQDSIKQILDNAPDDSTRVEILLQLARAAGYQGKKASIEYLEEALQFENDEYKRAIIKDTLGLFNWQMGNFNEAISHFKEALLTFEEFKDSLWLGKVINNIAVVNYGLGNKNIALEHYFKALNIRKSIDDKAGVSRVLNNIGMIYQEWGLFDEAIKYHEEALSIAMEINNNTLVAYSYSNIGNYFEKKENYKKALEKYYTGQEYLLKEDENNHFNSYLSSFIGSAYSKMMQLDSALIYFTKSLDYAQRINNKNFTAAAYHNIGETYLKTHKIKLAEDYIKKSNELSRQNGYNDLTKENLYVLSKIEDKKGNIKNAYNYYKRATALKDSLFNIGQLKKFTELQIDHFNQIHEQEKEILKRDNEIQKATIRNQRIVGQALILGGILILIILVFILRSKTVLKKLSQKLEISENELRKANADKDKFLTIIGHDLKSPIGGMLNLTEELHNNFDEHSAEEIKMMLGVTRRTTKKVFSLLEDLLQWAKVQAGKIDSKFEKIDIHESTQKTIDLLSMNAEEKNITLKNKIEKNTHVITGEKAISTILRNLISNAIKFTHSGGKVILESAIKGKETEISVIDNGVGIDKSELEKLFDITRIVSKKGTANESGTGLGLIICKELIEINNGTIRVESETGKGSRFIFTLPNKAQ